MELDLAHLSVDELQNMLSQAEADLTQALLGGESWPDILAKRKMVTHLSILVHQRKYPLGPSVPNN